MMSLLEGLKETCGTPKFEVLGRNKESTISHRRDVLLPKSTLPPTLADQAMAKLTKATLTKKIQERTGLSRRKAQKGLKEVLKVIKIALQAGKAVQFPGVGRLAVVERKRKRVLRDNLKGPCPGSIVDLHKKHPRSVRLLGGKDMSDDPKPTIVHKKQPEQQVVPARSTHFRVAAHPWRRRFK